MAIVAGASPKATTPSSQTTLTLTNSTCSTLLSAVINGVFNAKVFSCVVISSILML